jgi:hypothetical protein
VSDNGFIFMLAFGAALLVGILTVAHVSAYRLKQRLRLRRQTQALAPDVGSIIEPELDLGPDVAGFGDAALQAGTVSVRIRHAETAR